MRINDQGQVTAPAVPRRHDDAPGIAGDGETRGRRLVAAMRGKATTTMTTDELIDLLRGEST